MSEVPKPQSASDKDRAESLDWSAVADALEQQGQHELAVKIRTAAQNQTKDNLSSKKLDEQQKAANQKVLDQLASRQPAIQDPQQNAHIFNTQERAQVQELVKKLSGQNQLASQPKGPTPPGGK